jgi:hypothetical protein
MKKSIDNSINVNSSCEYSEKITEYQKSATGQSMLRGWMDERDVVKREGKKRSHRAANNPT